jgi:hypothetical protein
MCSSLSITSYSRFDAFSEWGIYFTMCRPSSNVIHNYIIVVVDYFTKWVEAMPKFLNDAKTATLFCIQPHYFLIWHTEINFD